MVKKWYPEKERIRENGDGGKDAFLNESDGERERDRREKRVRQRKGEKGVSGR